MTRLGLHFVVSGEVMKKVECETHGCGLLADSFVQWGTDTAQQGNLCAEHINAVWVKSQPLIASGKLFWIQGPVKEEG